MKFLALAVLAVVSLALASPLTGTAELGLERDDVTA